VLATFDYTGAATLVAAIGGIVAAVLTFLQRKPIQETHANAENTAAAVTMTNGTTIAGAVEGIVAAGNGNVKPIPTDKMPGLHE
jgi:hypothetical protein